MTVEAFDTSLWLRRNHRDNRGNRGALHHRGSAQAIIEANTPTLDPDEVLVPL